MRYVESIGAKQSSAGGTTYGRIARYYVNPGLLRRISLTTYRKCGGGFAKTGRALPCPVPAQCAGTVDGGCVRAVRGEPPRRFAPPLPRGEWTRRARRGTRPSSKPIPLLGGVPPVGGGVVPPQGVPHNLRPSLQSPPSLEGGAASAAGGAATHVLTLVSDI
ncbi:MAG: hypothetical protein LBM98_03570 [Oscillospiraceae bacterium]|nr:hypothetical protein [Oscillospiraceae bacterium]